MHDTAKTANDLAAVRIEAEWRGTPYAVTEHLHRSSRHSTFYLACGADGSPPVILVHGWPELSISWRHQLPCLAALGFRAVAPDMRGYGRSTVHERHEDYAIEEIVADMVGLLDHLGHEKAIWVGHDWGSPVVWNIASHHPERCHGVANLCVPYLPTQPGVATAIDLIDRSIYPVEEFPAGQWEYQLYYREHFEQAQRVFEANVAATVTALFRAGDPSGRGKPSRTAYVRRHAGWFGGAAQAPDLPLDRAVLAEADLAAYVSALTRTGFHGPNSWYMNNAANAAYAQRSVRHGRIAQPALFLHAEYDYTCETVESRLAEPMRAHCENLTERLVRTGHWMAQENPIAVNKALAEWISRELPNVWRG